jgi:hypothetical protein
LTEAANSGFRRVVRSILLGDERAGTTVPAPHVKTRCEPLALVRGGVDACNRWLTNLQTCDEARQDVFDYVEIFYNPIRKQLRKGCCRPSSWNGSSFCKPKAFRKLEAIQTADTHHWYVLKTANDSFRFRASTVAAPKTRKEKSPA